MNNDTKKKAAIIFLTVALSLSAVSALLRTLNMLFFFDSFLGYYQKGAALPIISNILLALGAVFFTVFAFVFFKKQPMSISAPCRTETVISSLSAAVAVFAAGFELVKAFKGNYSITPIALLSLVCAAYFLIAIHNVKPLFKVLSGLLLIIRITLMLAGSYFNHYVQMNAPDKIMFGLACVLSLLFIASELKLFVDNARSHMYFISAALVAVFSLTSSIPSIIAYHAGRLPEDNGLYAEYYLLLAIAIYAGARLSVQIIRTVKAKAPQTESENTQSCEE